MSTTASRADARATSQIVILPPIPELLNTGFLDVLIPAFEAAPKPNAAVVEMDSAMMDASSSTAHQKLTTNNASAFSSTLVPTLDAYLGLRTGVSGENVDSYLEKAWAEDLTLRIIWNTKSIHDGKGEKELFYQTFGWLFENHPRTAITNLHYLADPVCGSDKHSDAEKKEQGTSHGYWKDLLNILALATLDELRPKLQLNPRSNFLRNYYDGKSRPTFKNNQEQEKWSRAQRHERSRLAYDRLTQKLLDSHYRALFIAVARLFAGQLAKESDVMDKIAALPANANKDERRALMHMLTLTSKWAPTPGGSHDRVTNIASAICLLLHEAQVPCVANHKIPSSVATSLPACDMHLLRNLYQKHILTRGRRYINVPESLMSANDWSKIEYSRVASICMNNNKEKFFMHDESRFLDYLQDVESGKRQISGATLLPHVLAMEAAELHFAQEDPEHEDTTRSLASAQRERQRALAAAQMRVVDAQWAKIVARLWESGQLDNCIAICDVSGFMGYMGYTARPLKDSELASKWKTNHDIVMEAYAQAGYDVPEMVYWNLSNPRDGNNITAPVTGDRKGVALLNGYSPSTLKVFMDVDEDEWEVVDKEGQSKTEKASLTPEEFMKKALGMKSYDGLIVID